MVLLGAESNVPDEMFVGSTAPIPKEAANMTTKRPVIGPRQTLPPPPPTTTNTARDHHTALDSSSPLSKESYCKEDIYTKLNQWIKETFYLFGVRWNVSPSWAKDLRA